MVNAPMSAHLGSCSKQFGCHLTGQGLVRGQVYQGPKLSLFFALGPFLSLSFAASLRESYTSPPPGHSRHALQPRVWFCAYEQELSPLALHPCECASYRSCRTRSLPAVQGELWKGQVDALARE